MKFIFRLIFSFFINLIALLIAGNFVSGFEITDNFVNLLIATVIFTLINFYIRPIIKLVLRPIIFLSFGLATLAINAGMLYLLDIFSQNVTITGKGAYIYGTLIITAINFFLHLFTKFFYK